MSAASGGAARFLGLQIIAALGSYQLRFAPPRLEQLHLAPAALGLRLRGCVAGEANVSLLSAAGSRGVLTPCQVGFGRQARGGRRSEEP